MLYVPSQMATIQAALNACQLNDTVLVAPGVYNENLVWPAVNGIKLLSDSGSFQTIVSAGNNGRALVVSTIVADTSTHISGFTFRDGFLSSGNTYGAGIYITNASITFSDVRVSANHVFEPLGHGYGAGVHLSNSSSIFKNCTVTGNSIDSATWCYGAGIYVSGGSPVFTDVIITDNRANSKSWCYGTGFFARANAVVTIDRMTITDNYSGDDAIYYYGNGMYLGNVTATVVNLLVARNHSGAGGSFNNGGGIFCDGNTGSMNFMNVTVANNYKINNGNIDGSGIYVRSAAVTIVNSILDNFNAGPEVTNSGGTLDITFSDIRNGYTGNGNITMNPLFISVNDYHLLPASPCAGSGTDSNAPAYDLDDHPRPVPAGTKTDMGCYETDQSVSAVSEITDVNKIRIYPNPVSRGNTVYAGNLTGEIIISDMAGKVIYRKLSGDNCSISTSGWPEGMYLVSGPGKITEKLIILITSPSSY